VRGLDQAALHDLGHSGLHEVVFTTPIQTECHR
jgi:hypothetical protein